MKGDSKNKIQPDADIFLNYFAYYMTDGTNGMSFEIFQNYLKPPTEYGVVDDEYQLSLELYSSLSKYGNQSFLNTFTGITTFLMSVAVYFAIFKNTSYIDFYDAKIKVYYDLILDGKFESIRGALESISINEINR